jgi:hypothetical protein
MPLFVTHTRTHSGTESAEELESAAAEQAAWGEYFSNFISPDLDPVSPMGDIVYPIIDKRMIDTVQAIGTENETYFPPQNEAVGLIVASMYWRDLINGG